MERARIAKRSSAASINCRRWRQWLAVGLLLSSSAKSFAAPAHGGKSFLPPNFRLREAPMTSPPPQKLRINGPVIITANRLSDGAVVHRMSNGEWSVDLDDAEVLTTLSEAQAALKAAQADGVR